MASQEATLSNSQGFSHDWDVTEESSKSKENATKRRHAQKHSFTDDSSDFKRRKFSDISTSAAETDAGSWHGSGTLNDDSHLNLIRRDSSTLAHMGNYGDETDEDATEDEATQEYSLEEGKYAWNAVEYEEDDELDLNEDDSPVCLSARSSPVSNENYSTYSDTICQNEKNSVAGINRTSSQGDASSALFNSSSDTFNESKEGDTDIVIITDASSPDRLDFRKTDSIIKDAKHITSVLGNIEEETVIRKLFDNRQDPDRLSIVTNELLEKNLSADPENVFSNSEAPRISPDVREANTEGSTSGTHTRNNDSCDTLFGDVEKVLRLVKELQPDKTLDPNEVYVLLEQCTEQNRVGSVVKSLMNEESGGQNESGTAEKRDEENSHDIMDDVTLIIKRFPSIDPNEVFDLVEQEKDAVDRVDKVMKKLSERIDSGHSEEKSKERNGDGDNNDVTDKLLQDTETLCGMFPDKDKNEIYAYLEAHYANPNRVQVVSEELLRMDRGNQSLEPVIDLTETDSVTSRGKEPLINKSVIDSNLGGQFAQLATDIENIKAIFPDCDPNYIFEKLSMSINQPERVETLIAEMFDTKNYPKLKDQLEKEKKDRLKKRLINMQMNIPEFLRLFDDPVTYFNNTDKPVSEKYKQHVLVQLKNNFPLIHEGYINKVVQDNKGHFTPCYRALEQEAEAFLAEVRRDKKKYRQTPRDETAMPDEPDELFYQELLFTRHEVDIKEYLKRKETEKARRREIAKEKGELCECGCCYDDEVLMEDMLPCPEQHMFCRECVRRSSEAIIGDAKVKFPCLAGDCDKEFSMATIRKVLSANMFSILLRKKQEEEIKQADIPNLVSCPFCSFATIMDNADDKVFRCQNSDCLKESCRFCKEPNHIPLRCEEVEKSKETDMRTFIESRMTEAMIRICWRCKKRFFKVSGCNKMTCTCGASMCYVCRKPITDYSHFGNGPGQCPNDTNVLDLHRQEMEKAAAEARKKYEDEHPDAAGAELKYDPTATLQKDERDSLFRQTAPQLPPPPMYNPFQQVVQPPQFNPFQQAVQAAAGYNLFQAQQFNPFQPRHHHHYDHDDDDEEDGYHDDEDEYDDDEEEYLSDDEDRAEYGGQAPTADEIQRAVQAFQDNRNR